VSKTRTLGYGTRQRIAFDLRVPPSRLSGVLNAREMNPDILARVEDWCRENAKP
jgi:hypothetical protein